MQRTSRCTSPTSKSTPLVRRPRERAIHNRYILTVGSHSNLSHGQYCLTILCGRIHSDHWWKSAYPRPGCQARCHSRLSLQSSLGQRGVSSPIRTRGHCRRSVHPRTRFEERRLTQTDGSQPERFVQKRRTKDRSGYFCSPLKIHRMVHTCIRHHQVQISRYSVSWQ